MGFAIIRSKGDKVLFRLDTAQLKCKMGIPHSRLAIDFLPTVNMKAKDLTGAMIADKVHKNREFVFLSKRTT